jgi:glycosyltransferase involved in cell wall biosynthesis
MSDATFPTISVIIPTFNGEGTIGEAIDSILAQDIPVTEIIVIDDGSNDDTARLAERRSELVRVIRVPNGGPSRARNRGIEEATGELIAFLDDDDAWLPGKLAAQLNVLERDQDLDLIATSWSRLSDVTLPERGSLSRLTYYQILLYNRFQTSTVLARRSAIEEISGFDPALDGVEDWDFWLRLSADHRLAVLDVPYVFYRDNPNGVSKDLQRFYLGMRSLMERETEIGRLDRKLTRTIFAWHHLRLALAFFLSGSRDRALSAVTDLFGARLGSALPAACTKYFFPYLADRARRRLNRGRRADTATA